MKLRNLSLVLFFAACGGGGGNPPVIVDTPGGDGGGVFPNSLNDMVYFSPVAETQEFTASTGDSPDNQDAPVVLGTTGAARFSGEMGIAGDKADEYLERDTFLLTTGPTTNQITIRMDADSTTADMDFVLWEAGDAAQPSCQTPPCSFGSGTLIADQTGEFQTFVVPPNTNFWVWGGVYNVLEEGGNPTLPATYDFSIYGEAKSPPGAGNCDFTEAADVTNDILSEGVPSTNKEETSNQSLTTGTIVYCGTMDNGHFVPDAMMPQVFGIVDIDAFSLSIDLEDGVDQGLDVIITLEGETANDQAALANMLQVEYEVLNNVTIGGEAVHQFFTRGFFQSSHGVLTTTLPLSSTVDDTAGSMTMGQVVGPKSIAIIGLNAADIPADIKYKVTISRDVRNTRAPRVTSGGTAEANDN